MFYIDIRSNKINSINPDFFKNLQKVKYIQFSTNQCFNNDLGCETCSIPLSQSDLDSGFSTCFSNCVNNVDDCTTKSGNIENLSQDEIREKIDTLVSYGQLDMLIERNFVDVLIEKGYKDAIIKNDWRLTFAFDEINNLKKDSAEFQKSFSSELEQQKILFENLDRIMQNLSKEIARTSKQLANGLGIQQNNVSSLNKTIKYFLGIVKEAKDSCENQVENSKKILESQTQVIEEAAKARHAEVENQLKTFSEQFNRSIGKCEDDTKKMIEDLERTFKEDTTNALSSNLEKTDGKVEILSLKFSEIKALMEVERMQWKLKEAEHTIEKQAFELQMEKMKMEYAEKLEAREAALEKNLAEKYGEMINQKIDAFRNELMNDFRP
jgi:mRNA-degrading endonuclease YafQ of YafQ-DinJ toxin-antitoxin module